MSRSEEVADVVRQWWSRDLGGERFDTGAARKARAQLRRAASPSDVLALEATHRLLDGLVQAGTLSRSVFLHNPKRLALVASVIANLDAGATARLPRRFGQNVNDMPVLSHLRFQRLLHAQDDWALAIALRRALPIVGRKANVGSLGTDLVHWGETVRNRWCFDYFGAPPPGMDTAAQAPDTEQEDD